MSTGVFLGIGASYAPGYEAQARSLIAAVDAKLMELGELPIADPAKAPHVCDARIGLDAMGSGTLADLGERAGRGRPHAHLLAINPYRLVYVPRSWGAPQATSHRERIAGRDVQILLGSSIALQRDLLDLAPELGIPLSNGALADDVAKKIDDLEPLREGETDWDLVENTRVAWLLMHEAAALAIARDVPISLAG
jgi:hypothetical protein